MRGGEQRTVPADAAVAEATALVRAARGSGS
jgi:hypothetical protein